MKNKFKVVLVIASLFLVNTNTLSAQSYPWQDSSFALVFNDDFNGSVVDSSKWVRRYSWGPTAVDSNKVQVPKFCDTSIAYHYVDYAYCEYHYADTNFLKVSNGTAKILVKKENVTGETWSTKNNVFTVKQFPFKYCTSMLRSKYHFKYGYFEIRFRLPTLPTSPQTFMGMGPNFWLYNANNSLNNAWSEIDVFEIHAYNNLATNNIIYQSYPKDSLNFYSQGVNYAQISSPNWHTAGAYWTPNNIEIYFDGIKINQITDSRIKPDSMVEMPILLTMNAPTQGWCELIDTANTVFPYTYEIDYVKVWQPKEACDTSKTYCSNFNPVTYKSKIYSDVTIGGTGCNSPVNNYSNLSIRGKNYVLLNEGFSIDNNSDVLIDNPPCSGKVNSTYIPSYYAAPPPSFNQRHK